MRLSALLMLALASLFTTSGALAAGGFAGEKFEKVFYFSGPLGKGAHTGSSLSNALPIADANVWAIPAGTVISKAYMVVDTAITGTSALTVGDTDAAAGFIPNAAITLATPGMYGWDAKSGGSYLRIQTAGATDAGDIYVVPSAKYYSAAGKYLTIDNTTTNTAGVFRVVVEGYRIPN